MANQLENFTKAATRFRQMIENTDRSKLPVEFKNFPGWAPGSRDDEKIHESWGRIEAPILLAQYLIDLGYGIPTYVRAELLNPDLRWAHTWLELDGIVLDIALDGMFSDAPKVIVEEHSDSHEIFRRLDENPVAIHIFDERTVSMLRAVYHEIIGMRLH